MFSLFHRTINSFEFYCSYVSQFFSLLSYPLFIKLVIKNIASSEYLNLSELDRNQFPQPVRELIIYNTSFRHKTYTVVIRRLNTLIIAINFMVIWGF